MRRVAPTIVLALLLQAVCCGQEALTVRPAKGQYLGYASAKAPGKWIVAAEGWKQVAVTVLEGGTAVMFEGAAGTYGVFYFPSGDAQPVLQSVTLGGADVPPPGPGPGPGPGPDPPAPGVRHGVILVETLEQTPDQAILWAQCAKAFKPDQLRILDDDLPEAAKYVKLVKASTRPVLIVLGDQDQLVRESSVPSSVDAIKQELAR